jgi:hypothetical protein
MRIPKMTMPAPIRILSLVVKLDSGLGAGLGVGAMVLVGAGETSAGFVSRGVIDVIGAGEVMLLKRGLVQLQLEQRKPGWYLL